ncbi:MAG: hypothetical protein AB2747_05820 [Candidatus Thiodiazotropha taylori]
MSTPAVIEQYSSSPYRTIKQFVNENQAFSEGGLRWEIFNEATNGLRESGAILRNGRKVLIHVPRYFRWLDSKNGVLPEIDPSGTNAA